MKDAVRFFDPVSQQPEKIQIDTDLKKAVESALAAYIEYLEKEKEAERKKIEEENKLKEMTEKEWKEKEIRMKKKESLAKSEEDLHAQEKIAREELDAASELLKTANAKFDEVLASASVEKSSIRTGKMMLEKANAAHAEALKKLDKIREKQKKIGTTMHKLLDEVLPSTSGSGKVSKGSGKKRREKWR